MRAWRAGAALSVVTAVWLLTAGPAAADNCSTPNDCYATDTAATRAGQGLLGLLLLYLLAQLLGRGAGAGWGWPGGGRDLFGGEGGPGDGSGGLDGLGGVGGDNGSLTDRLLGWLDQAFGDGGGTILGGRVGGSQDLLSGELFGADGRLTVTGQGIAELVGKAAIKLDESGLAAELGLGATVGTEVSLAGSLQSGWIMQTATGTLFVGATAEASGGLQLGSGGLGLHGEAEAFAGGKASGAYELDVGPASGTIGGSVSYGIGYKAEGDVSFSWTDIGFSGKGGATFGLGAEADIEISVNPEAVIDGISNALDFFGW
jgi:hypothetical protein